MLVVTKIPRPTSFSSFLLLWMLVERSIIELKLIARIIGSTLSLSTTKLFQCTTSHTNFPLLSDLVSTYSNDLLLKSPAFSNLHLLFYIYFLSSQLILKLYSSVEWNRYCVFSILSYLPRKVLLDHCHFFTLVCILQIIIPAQEINPGIN